MSTKRTPKPRLRYTPCKDVEDAMDMACFVGGSILFVDGQWRCYQQVNRLFLDFPHLKAPGELLREQIRNLRGDGGLTDEKVMKFMANWYEDGKPLGPEGVQAILDELDKHAARQAGEP